MRRAQPLTLGEKTFPSLTAAAQHFNMSISTVSRRHSKGESYAEIFGVVEEPAGAKGKAQGRAKSITVHGKTYNSIAEFARQHNMDPAKVRARLHDGEKPEDIIATSKSAKPEQYKIDGRTFTSVKSLAKHYNMSPKKVQENLDKGLSIAQAVGVSFVPHTQANNTMSMVIDDNAYFSLDEIINAFNLDKAKFIGLIAEQYTFQEAVDLLRKEASESQVEVKAETTSRQPKPITIAGVEYPSESAAAKAHKISPSAFYQRRKKGMTPEEAVGLTKSKDAPKGRTRVPVEATAARSQPITCDGKVYPSQRELARAFGISPHSLRYALKSGRTPEQAVGLAKPSPSERSVPHHNAKQVSYKGKDYNSIRELSDDYGVPVANVRYRLNKGDSLDDILAPQPIKADPVKHEEAKAETPDSGAGPQPITYRGTEYRSIRAFAQKFDADPAQVRYRLKKGWTPAQAIDRAEPPQKVSKSNSNMVNITEMMPVTVNGTEYHTAKALADAYELKSSVVTGRLRNGWSPEEAVELVPHRVGKRSSFLRVQNKTFNNARDLAEAYNVPYRTVQYRLSQGASAPEAVGLKEWKGKPHRGKSVTFNGKEYSSKKALAEAFGVDYNKFLSRVARGWNLTKALNNPKTDKVEKPATAKKAKETSAPSKSKSSVSKAKTTAKPAASKAKTAKKPARAAKSKTPIKLDGPIKLGILTFDTVSEFADKLGLDVRLVANRLSDNWTPEQIAGLQPAP